MVSLPSQANSVIICEVICDSLLIYNSSFLICFSLTFIRDVTVCSLLFMDSGRALLNIIDTGVDTVEMKLAAQGR